jgi:hypothetical protein
LVFTLRSAPLSSGEWLRSLWASPLIGTDPDGPAMSEDDDGSSIPMEALGAKSGMVRKGPLRGEADRRRREELEAVTDNGRGSTLKAWAR